MLLRRPFVKTTSALGKSACPGPLQRLRYPGSVEHVGLKTTRIRADCGEQIVISNADLLKNVVRNYKRMSTRRVQLSFRINPHGSR